MTAMSFKRCGLFAALSLVLTAPSMAAGVTDKDIMADQQTTEDVVTYGMGLRGQRFSPMDTINKETVSEIRPVWGFSLGGEKQRGQESQPMIKDGVMYITGSYSRVYAIDARTGDELWQYDARLPDGIMPCCDVINRGVALYDDLVIFGTLDAKLVALDAKTGKVRWKKTVDNYQDGYSITAAPIVVKGNVITGVSGGEFGIIGKVRAYDAKTGKLVWERPTVEGHMGYVWKDGKKIENGISGGAPGKTWPADLWKSGGAAPWLGGTYDADTDLLFFGTGNPAPWNSHMRPGDNLFSSSRLAIDPDDGKIVWHFQTTPHDGWDFDGVNELIAFDYEQNGKTVKAAATADRNGFFYVLDRTSGEFIRGFPFVNKISWAKGLDDKGRPLYIDSNRPGNPTDVADGKKGQTVVATPSFLGGKNWMPMAYSPKSGLFYVPSNEWEMDIWNEPVSYKKGAAYLGAGFTIKSINDDYIGALRAYDPKTGERVWEYKNYAPLWGGVMTTAGGLVFTGNPEGYLMAFDDKTGELLYKFNTGSGIVGTPVTWEMDGEQYISILSGWGERCHFGAETWPSGSRTSTKAVWSGRLNSPKTVRSLSGNTMPGESPAWCDQEVHHV
ncbi:alcohol dehydrogenase (cytochrome c) [Enterovibrio nigricans DSM 22720]|uniref:Alcohol dehydrogenase (Cytochrome c) n=1 Tax=Enterovibrio nigricans DSM 22720 TaxID=1121868 RepID=A0A1T4U129_9GAMM|nr:PQQ-dependent methanol/ethanol family dehydrogenase [Enterovibrio nigricans]SKA46360.1 alcohol dehydrogenase (cytochrome c) [Enterovibrio nigricans DSM 22720]